MGITVSKLIVVFFGVIALLIGCNSKSDSENSVPKRYLYFSSQFPEKSFHWYIEVNYKATRDIFFCKTITEASFQPDPRNKTVNFSVDSSGGPLKIPLFQEGLLDCGWKLISVHFYESTSAGKESIFSTTHDTIDDPLPDSLKFSCSPEQLPDIKYCKCVPEPPEYGYAFKDSTSSLSLFLSVNLMEKINE